MAGSSLRRASPRSGALVRAEGIAAIVILLSSGCATTGVPDPGPAAERFAAAAERGDADAIHSMLTEDAQRRYGTDGTRERVRDARTELARRGKALRGDATTVEAVATVRYLDGETASLEVQDGRFYVSSAAALPAGARSPVEALAQLRHVLARRSYAGLVRVLTAETRSAIESDLRSLVEGLEEPESLDVQVRGDTAVVSVPGGHQVTLRREEGVWRVRDFD